MRFNSIRRWLPLLLALLLVACGGGGGTPTLGGSTGTTPGSSGPVVQVALSSSTVTAASPATVTITLLDASGNAIDGAVVDVSMERGTYASLSLSSVNIGRAHV